MGCAQAASHAIPEEHFERGFGAWQDMEIGRFSPLRYGRDIRVSPHDARVLYACLSPAAQSTDCMRQFVAPHILEKSGL